MVYGKNADLYNKLIILTGLFWSADTYTNAVYNYHVDVITSALSKLILEFIQFSLIVLIKLKVFFQPGFQIAQSFLMEHWATFPCA